MGEAKKADNKGFFTQVYDGWLLFAELAGRFNTKVIVGIIYFALVSVAWFLTSAVLKRRLLDRAFRVSAASAWQEKNSTEQSVSLEKLRHQF